MLTYYVSFNQNTFIRLSINESNTFIENSTVTTDHYCDYLKELVLVLSKTIWGRECAQAGELQASGSALRTVTILLATHWHKDSAWPKVLSLYMYEVWILSIGYYHVYRYIHITYCFYLTNK